MNTQSLLLINIRNVSEDIVDLISTSMLKHHIPQDYLSVMYDDVVIAIVYEIYDIRHDYTHSRCKHDLSKLVLDDVTYLVKSMLYPIITKSLTPLRPYMETIKVMPTYSELVIVKSLTKQRTAS